MKNDYFITDDELKSVVRSNGQEADYDIRRIDLGLIDKSFRPFFNFNKQRGMLCFVGRL